MKLEDEPNPYLPAIIVKRTRESLWRNLGTLLGMVVFLICGAPSLYMSFICMLMLGQVAFMTIPETTIRPMGLPVAMLGLTIIGAVLAPIAIGCSWLAKWLGSTRGAIIARGSVGFIILPFMIGFLSFFVLEIICVFRCIAISD